MKMQRLDSLTTKELKKLYARSRFLSFFGILQIIAAVFICIGGFCFWEFWFGESLDVNAVLWLTSTSVTLLISAFVFMYARTVAAKVYLYVYSIIGIIASVCCYLATYVLVLSAHVMALAVCCLFGAPLGQNPPEQVLEFSFSEKCSFLLLAVWSVLLIFLLIKILLSAKTKLLFGAGSFTHKQIAYARKKIKRGEPFTDEELPPAVQFRSVWTKIALVFAYIGIPLFIVLMFFGDLGLFFFFFHFFGRFC